MFFILSKFLSFALSPIWWISVLLIAYLVLKKYRNRSVLLIMAVSLLLLFSNQWLFYHVSGWWEGELENAEQVGNYDGIILLGGFSNYRSKSQRLQFTRSSDRLLQAVKLYKEGKAHRFIFTGGSSRIILREKSGGEFLKDYLCLLEIPKDSILTEWKARNTYENAVETLSLLKANKIANGKYLLVTSGFHMKRALACFEKVGIDVMPFKTDALQGNIPPEFWECLTPSASVMATWELLIKEWIGYVVYRIKGYV